MSSNRTIRLRTTPGESQNIQVKIEQEFDTLDILSLKITQEEAYRNFCSDYGVVAGRVIANDGFGVENAKVSVFIPLNDEDAINPKITTIYPFTTPNDLNAEGIRYNLLPRNGKNYYIYEKIPVGDTPTTYWNNPNFTSQGTFAAGSSWALVSGVLDDGTQIWRRLVNGTHGPKVPVGTMPSKLDILDNGVLLDVYDKYYRLSTTTNSSGDYMIFGVPVGNQTVHMDVDLSDAGNVSLSVQDFINNGFPQNLFDGNNFKTSTNLDSLPQIESRNITVEVVPFWGNLDQCEIGITRLDINLNKTITPSAVLVFHSFTNISKHIKKNCTFGGNGINDDEIFPDIGNMQPFDTVTTAFDPFFIQSFTQESENGNTVIKIPMVDDRYVTDEFGNYVPSPDPNKGIPTRGRYRFFINPKNQQLSGDNHRASYVFPDSGLMGASYVTLRYDLKNNTTRFYTIGNKNSGLPNNTGDNARLIRIESQANDGSVNNITYPVSCKSSNGNADMFGGGAVCYGSLYFPRFEVDNNGNVCSAFLTSTSNPPQMQNASGRRYNEALLAYSLLDITFLFKKFKPFGNWSVTSAYHGVGTWLEPGVIPSPCGNNNSNGVNLMDHTIPLKNSVLNVPQSPTLGTVEFPYALDTEQVSPFDNSVVYYATYDSPPISNANVIQIGTRSIPGRYFFYFGLSNSNNIIKYLYDTEDV